MDAGFKHVTGGAVDSRRESSVTSGMITQLIASPSAAPPIAVAQGSTDVGIATKVMLVTISTCLLPRTVHP